MKKSDLKQAYDNISISDAQKERIYNNIMEKSSKKKINYIPFIFFGSAVAVSICLIFLGTNMGIKPNNGNIELANNYKREVVVNINKYLSANKVDLEELRVGEELEIDSNKIVDNKDYNVCSGKVVIKRYKDGYTYTPKTNCGNNTNDKEVSYYIYDGKIDNLVVLDDNYLIETHLNIDKDFYDDNILLFNENGELLFEYTINRQTKNGNVTVANAFKVNDNYLLILDYSNNIVYDYNDDGDALASSNPSLGIVLLDNKGQEIKNDNITSLQEEFSRGYFDFVNRDNDKLYFLSYTNDNKGIYYELDINTLSITNKIDLYDVVDAEGMEVNYIGIYDNLEFVDDYSYELQAWDYKTGKMKKSITHPDNYTFKDIYRKDNRYYLYYFEQVKDGEITKTNEYIITYDNDFNKLNEFKLDSYDYIYYNRINVSDKVYISTTNFNTEENNIYTLNLDGKKESKEKVNPLEENMQKEWGFYDYFTKTKDGINMIYTAQELKLDNDIKEDTNTDNQILFVTIR